MRKTAEQTDEWMLWLLQDYWHRDRSHHVSDLYFQMLPGTSHMTLMTLTQSTATQHSECDTAFKHTPAHISLSSVTQTLRYTSTKITARATNKKQLSED